jgi:hypothetical protein
MKLPRVFETSAWFNEVCGSVLGSSVVESGLHIYRILILVVCLVMACDLEADNINVNFVLLKSERIVCRT